LISTIQTLPRPGRAKRHLRQQHAPRHQNPVHADRLGGLDLAPGYGEIGAPEDFRGEGAVDDAEGYETRQEGVDVEDDVDTEVLQAVLDQGRRAVVDDEDEDQLGHAADHRGVGVGACARGVRARHLAPGADHAENQGQGHGAERHRQGDLNAFPQHPAIALQVEHASACPNESKIRGATARASADHGASRGVSRRFDQSP
jgi:hypothetical protein